MAVDVVTLNIAETKQLNRRYLRCKINKKNIVRRIQKAACVLGDGWTVDVIAHIFSFM